MYPQYYHIIQDVILVSGILLLTIGLIKPQFLAPAYLLMIVFRPGEVYPSFEAIRFELLSVILIITAVVINIALGKSRIIDHPISKAAYIFYFLCLISIIQAFDIKHSYEYAYQNLFPVIILFSLIIMFTNSKRDIWSIITVYIILASYLTWLPIFNHLHNIGAERLDAGIIHSQGDTSGVAGHVAVANFMTQSLAFSYFYIFCIRGYIRKILLSGFMILFILATVYSGSRGGFIGILICATLFVLKSRKKGISIIFVILGFFIVSSVVTDNYLIWMDSILDFGKTEYSASTRWDGLLHGIYMAIRRPVLGVGIGCFSVARKAWYSWGIWAHNLYGEMLGELGIIGSLSWFYLIFLCFIEIRRIKRFVKDRVDVDPLFSSLADACYSVLILRLIIGFTTHSVIVFIWYMVAGLLIAASTVLCKEYPEYVSADGVLWSSKKRTFD